MTEVLKVSLHFAEREFYETSKQTKPKTINP